MKWTLLISVLGMFVATACSDQVVQETFDDPAKHNMKFIPDHPDITTGIKLIVFDDCNYNILSGITRKGNNIDIQKAFNGMMKRPCLIQNDTIVIGKLSAGSYTIHYKLMNIAYTPAIPALSLTFPLYVSR
jgi:hypothetical protein